MEPPLQQRGRRLRLKKEKLAVLLSVVAAVVVVVQRFLTEHTLLLLPSQTMALEESVRATKVAISRLQVMLALAEELSEMEESDQKAAVGVGGRSDPAPRRSSQEERLTWFQKFLHSAAATEDEQWRQNFRMGRTVFSSLLEVLRPELEQRSPEGSRSVAGPAPEVKLAAALYRLAQGASPRTVAKKFGLRGSTACAAAFDEVCKALQSRLSNLFDFPSAPELLHPIIEHFTEQGLPNCCGVVGCTRFPVEATANNASYFERGGLPTVVMQGVVDAAGRFLDISVGWGGSLAPANILLQTRLFARVVNSNELLHGHPVELLNGAPMPEYIIGDGAYPLLPWLLTPYTNPFTPAQHLFNRVHEHVRANVSRSFGVLKAHWRLLSTGALTAGDGCIVAAACILHNFLIYSREPMPAQHEPLSPEVCSLPPCDNSYGESIRDALAAHLSAVARLQTHQVP